MDCLAGRHHKLSDLGNKRPRVLTLLRSDDLEIEGLSVAFF